MTQSKETDYTFSLDANTTDTITITNPVEPEYTFDATGASTYTVSLDGLTSDYDTGPLTYDLTVDYINSDTVEKMTKLYPGLDKVWRNFKSVYDMCIQHYKGKQQAGELDDDIPF